GATGLGVTRALAGLPAHAFAAGLWGYALGERGHGGRFAPAWLLAVAIHAVYDHVVFGRGPGMLGVGVPMLVAMGLLTWSALRDIAPSTVDVAALPLPVHLPEPPRLRDIRRALQRTDRPVALGWVLTGAFVNVGTIVAALVAAVVAARSLGIDLAAADEADMRANGPLILFGSAVLGAFPVAGFVVARASGTRSLVEPALAAAIALVMTAALLSATAPIAVLVVLALAPVAFGLACVGGWFGLEA
ncbi:MAG: protease PrsW, partial [Deltaproteobacteria bacterium]|nr:protease PrsW [Deltaproteobacteria bacterium]